MLNEQIPTQQWDQFKGEVRKVWGKITDDDLERMRGNLNKLPGLVQQKYGLKRESVDTKIGRIVQRFQGVGNTPTEH